MIQKNAPVAGFHRSTDEDDDRGDDSWSARSDDGASRLLVVEGGSGPDFPSEASKSTSSDVRTAAVGSGSVDGFSSAAFFFFGMTPAKRDAETFLQAQASQSTPM